ncbi:ATP:guanido phosphotransferase [Clostridiales bacterium PH28_bin88]|nr:ATP:guanido phosphotransferase [Clostridiales bacterium PH28_bin88]
MSIMDAIGRSKSKWMEGSGPHSDIVITSRIRLARNLEEVPFPHIGEKAQQQVVNAVKKAVAAAEVERQVGKLEFISMNELPPLERQILVEKHLISPQQAQPGGQKAIVLREDEAISIMVNEEDHLRVQCLYPALQLHEAWRLANTLDDALENKLNFAFDERQGYLTTCPTNVGTGLRASVMMHLPALVMTKQAGRVLSALSQVGLAVRGLYGEGTEAIGNLFQVSNQITLGQNEEEIINNLSSVVKQIIDQERSSREVLMRESRVHLEDRVGRAYGTLTNARIISSQEALSLMSEIRMGIDLKLVKGVDARVLNELLVTIQPAFLQHSAGQEMESFERDVFRAKVIRQRLTGN